MNIAKQRPDLLDAYVGTAQLVDMRANLNASYQRVVERAREFGDNTAIGELNAIGPPPWKSVARWQLFRKWRNDFQAKVATAPRADIGACAGIRFSAGHRQRRGGRRPVLRALQLRGNVHDRPAHGCEPEEAGPELFDSGLRDPGRRRPECRAGDRARVREVDQGAGQGVHRGAEERACRHPGLRWMRCTPFSSASEINPAAPARGGCFLRARRR